jgi:hypothetical protein
MMAWLDDKLEAAGNTNNNIQAKGLNIEIEYKNKNKKDGILWKLCPS